MLWEVVTDGCMPWPDISDEDVSDLQLSSQDAAALCLIGSPQVPSNCPSQYHVLFETIRGTVRRHPVDEGGRMSWQDIFAILATAADQYTLSPDTEVSFVEVKDVLSICYARELTLYIVLFRSRPQTKAHELVHIRPASLASYDADTFVCKSF